MATPAVIDLITQRIKENSQPHQRKDKYKLGLVIEAGCMRGVVSAGMLTGIDALHARDSFDAIYATSAGSCDAMYFTAGQTNYGSAVYYNDVNNSKFVNILNALIFKPIMNLSYAIYQVMGQIRPLDTDKIIHSPIPINIYVADAKRAKVIDLSKFKTRKEVLDAMYYACDLPLIAGWPAKVMKNTYYTDGGMLVGALPLDQAIKDGCTHILCLLSRRKSQVDLRHHWYDFEALTILKRNFPALAKHYWDRLTKYKLALDEIREAERGQLQSARVEAIEPLPGSKLVKSFEKDRQKLIRGAKDGFEAVAKKFEKYHLALDPNIHIIE